MMSCTQLLLQSSNIGLVIAFQIIADEAGDPGSEGKSSLTDTAKP